MKNCLRGAAPIGLLSGDFNPNWQKRISFSKYVDKEMDSTSPVKKTKGCDCKRGCNKSCGYKKKGMKCHSGVLM
jgi:hypothetical protein